MRVIRHRRHGCLEVSREFGVHVRVEEIVHRLLAGGRQPAARHLITTSSAVAEIPVAPDATLTGVRRLSVAPSPIWPSLPPPQA
jgi:hypothetical protein